MGDVTLTTASAQDRETMLDALEMLKRILMEARDKLGDPGALSVILSKLATLVTEDLPSLGKMKATPEEKARMVQLQEQIDELERLLQTRDSILAGFSLYLKEMVEG